jgi:hypothetical protein
MLRCLGPDGGAIGRDRLVEIDARLLRSRARGRGQNSSEPVDENLHASPDRNVGRWYSEHHPLRTMHMCEMIPSSVPTYGSAAAPH